MTKLEALEERIAAIRSRPLVLLCRTPSGEEKPMSVAECVKTGSVYLHTVIGADLDDLDALLASALKNISSSL